MRLRRRSRIWHRYREIAHVLVKHGWGWMLSSLGLPEHKHHHDDIAPAEHAPTHLREMLEELGPTFVKFGQLLSTRADIVPELYVTELSKLQDTAPTVPFELIREVVESELGEPLGKLFEEFCEEPLAAASLGQVHRARLPDGTPVIVKVQRPDIEEIIDTDIEIMRRRAIFLESHSERLRTYGITDVVEEFATTILEEMDYTREAANTDRLRESMATESRIDVPDVYWDLTSRRVLTLEEMQGVKINDFIDCAPPEAKTRELADTLASAFLKQIFIDGFFHADPHPGNILVTPNQEIALVDCGQARRLDAENKAGAIQMLVAFEQHNTRLLADQVIKLGISRREIDARQFTRDLETVLRGYYDVRSTSVNMGQLLTKILNVSASHGVRLPVSFAVTAKVITVLDGICSRLDPDFNFTRVASRYVGRAVRSEFRAESAVQDFYRAVTSARHLVAALPEQIERLMRKAVEGTLRVEFKHMNLDQVEATIARSANRIAIALIVAGTIVGSSLVVSAGRGSKGWFGLPELGLLGYVVATVFGIWLVISILTSGKQGR